MDVQEGIFETYVASSSSSAHATSYMAARALSSKRRLAMSRSALDSEALASSDDDQDLLPTPGPASTAKAPRPLRRASWLAESQRQSQRKASHAGSDSFLPASPGPAATVGDNYPWTPTGSSAGRGHSSSQTFPWVNAIWNSEGQVGTGMRLGEMLPSPTGLNGTTFTGEHRATPPLRRDSISDNSIPFAIPLHPTLKAYRSQSYSVGQLEQEGSSSRTRPHAQYAQNGRTRAGSTYGSLQHRPSRPTMFGDYTPDTPVLGQLREVEDDGEVSTGSSELGPRLSGAPAHHVDKMAMEGAMLRERMPRTEISPSGAHGARSQRVANLPPSTTKDATSNENTLDGSDEMFELSSDVPEVQDHYRWVSPADLKSHFEPAQVEAQCCLHV